MLMVAAYALILISLVRLRVREPQLPRPYRIPLGTAGLSLMIATPLGLIVLVIYLAGIDRSLIFFGTNELRIFGWSIGWYSALSFLGLATGPFAYYFFTQIKKPT